MIKSFRHKGLREFYTSGTQRGIRPAHATKLALILDLLNSAASIGDMNFPGAHLHPLKGKLKGFWAVRVSGNWRIVFQFIDGDAFEVNYIDYH